LAAIRGRVLALRDSPDSLLHRAGENLDDFILDSGRKPFDTTGLEKAEILTTLDALSEAGDDDKDASDRAWALMLAMVTQPGGLQALVDRFSAARSVALIGNLTLCVARAARDEAGTATAMISTILER